MSFDCIPLLTFHQHFVKSDIKENKEENTRSVHKNRGRPAKTITV